jgi:heme o synthase
MPERPGAWARASALAAAAGSLGVVLAAADGLDVAHRVLAAISVVPATAVVVLAWWLYPALRLPATTALALLLAAAGSGAIEAAGGGHGSNPAHLALAALALASACWTAVRAGLPMMPEGSLRDHVTLTKPRIMTLLLLTGACAMVAGGHRLPGAGPFLLTMRGLGLGCGGAAALNHVLDADIDRQMRRTASRPVAAHRISAAHAAEFGVALSAASFVLLATAVNPAAAALCLFGSLFYVLIYTLVLKRRTDQNIVIGGAAGAIPPLVGWAAATGSIDLAALLLFLIVFLWTPPHFWALALLIRGDYERAAVPMLPVTEGERRTRAGIVRYTALLIVVTLAFAPADGLGLVYLVPVAAAGLVFAWLALALRRRPSRAGAARLFKFSLLYLAIVFAAIAVAAAA